MTYTAWIILTASLVGMSCGLIGVFLILRKMAMMADAISHTVLLGIVMAFIITRELSGMHMLVGAIFAGLLTALLVQWLHSLEVQQDASIGIVFTTLFAIGVILIETSVGNAHLDVQHALMGEITFIPWDKISLAIHWGGSKSNSFASSCFRYCSLVSLLLFIKSGKLRPLILRLQPV